MKDCYSYYVRANDKIFERHPAGGAIAVLVNKLLEDGVIVYAPIVQNLVCEYRSVTEISILEKIYFDLRIFCDETNLYNMLNEQLEMGNKVCVLGTPCVIAHIRSIYEKNIENLYLLTWKCEGQSTQEFFEASLKEPKLSGGQIREVRLPDKNKYGWNTAKRKISFVYSDGTVKILEFGEKYSFTYGIQNKISLCEKCYACKGNYKIGDFLIQESGERSLIFINSAKGLLLYESTISAFTDTEEAEIDEMALFNGIEVTEGQKEKHLYFMQLNKNHSFWDSVYMTLEEVFDIGFASGYRTANFGGALTQYAMYSVLKDMGYSVYLIERPLRAQHRLDENDILKVNDLYPQMEKAPFVENVYDCINFNRNCKMFLVGSDQYFNTYLYHATQEFFSLKWVEDCKPKIAYAASFGFDRLWDSEEQLARRKFFLRRFDKFSVREKSAINILKEKIDINAEWVLDPVFLCDKNNYEMLADRYFDNEKKYTGKYIFAYILDPSIEKEQILKKVADDLNLRIEIFSDMECEITQKDNKWGNTSYTRASLAEWLYALRGSEFVVTDSFHGTCFAVIYEKRLISILNPERGATRFATLAEVFGLANRFVAKTSDLETINLKEMNYDSINKELKGESTRCKKWLRENINLYLTGEKNYTEYDFFVENLPQIKRIGKVSLFCNLDELGLRVGSSVDEIISSMPVKSVFFHEQGAMGQPISGTPVPYGILEIYKGSDYFVKITFVQMTLADEAPKIFQGKYLNHQVVAWEEYVNQHEYNYLKKQVIDMRKDINFLMRKYADGLND